ncbi:MAG: type I-B CRISPR-associated protein Cas7/Csh2 [bacterium]
MANSIINNNSDFLFIYEAIQCNPNGDPDQENKPRMDNDTNTNLVTDVRLKRYIRDFLKNNGSDIFIDTEDDYKIKPLEKLLASTNRIIDESFNEWYNNRRIDHLEIGKLSKNEFINYLIEANKKKTKKISDDDEPDQKTEKANKKIDDFLLLLIENKFIDIRLFGGAFPIKGISKIFTGPIQLTWGYSLNKVKIIESSTIVSIMEDNSSTFGKDYRIYYSLIAFHGTINKNAAKGTGLSINDRELFRNAIWNSISASPTRSKINQYPKLFVEFEYNEEFGNGQFGDLRNYISVNPKNGLDFESVRKFTDLDFDCTKLIELKNNNYGADKIIKNVIVKSSPDININL